MRLRPYQEQALDALATHRREHPDETRLVISMATGLGKTITFAEEARRFCDEAAEIERVLILVHTDELAQQAEAKVRLMVDAHRVGVVKAERDEVDADIIIGSVQTLANPERRARIHDVGLIIVDECHHAVANTYQSILKHFGALGVEPECGEDFCDSCGDCVHCYGDDECMPRGGRHSWASHCTPVTGYTATPERGDGAALGHVWQNVVFSRDISWAVRKGFLVPPVGYTVTVPHLGAGHPGGEPSGAALDVAIVDSVAPEAVVDSWIEHAKGRSTVLFAPLVRSANAFRAAFQDRGIEAAVVHGAMPRDLRAAYLHMYERGKIQVLCNAMVLTEGWDVPRTKCVIWARPTTSRPLFIQGAGRGLRPWLDGPIPREEQDCVLLVLSDSTPGLMSIADLSNRPLEPQDGKSLLALEDEYDLSKDLEPDAPNAYAGRLDVREFDPLVARSSKVWNRTREGALFLPIGKAEYVTILPDSEGYAVAWLGNSIRMNADPSVRGRGARFERHVPDLELAMTLAEDKAQELGGDLGRLLADKTRPWRKGVPSEEQKELARSLGLGAELDKVMAQRSSGKAGKVSDLIAIVKASRLIDPAVRKLKERTGQ